MAAAYEPITGRYVRLDLAGRPHRVYFEEAGQGIPLVCLHTAGADGDFRDRVAQIDTSTCPLYLLTGEYDFSCTPEDTQRTAAKIKGAHVTVMKEIGHFPMSENPGQFRRYILPVLEEIRAKA